MMTSRFIYLGLALLLVGCDGKKGAVSRASVQAPATLTKTNLPVEIQNFIWQREQFTVAFAKALGVTPDRPFPTEPRQLKPGEDVKIVDGKAQAAGQVAVMTINGLIAKRVFDRNPDREFYPVCSTITVKSPGGSHQGQGCLSIFFCNCFA